MSITPPPPPPPPPPPSPGSGTPSGAAVVIFPGPTAGEYASLGVFANVGMWTDAGIPTSSDKGAVLVPRNDAGLQPKVRYTAAGTYEVQMPGEAYATLTHAKRVTNPTSDNTVFDLPRSSSFYVSGSRARGYQYSEMAGWWRPDLDFAFTADFGTVAFGTLTPAGNAPTTGTATYQGYLAGTTDVKVALDGGKWWLVPAEGTIYLQFDFGKSTLIGNLALFLPEGMGSTKIGDFGLVQTVLSNGNLSYSGKFQTNLPGANFFNGRFTGPNAQETIGAWAMPFTHDGANHQAMGAWVAKQ
ncbi:MAG TPA: transferrin-binding protein-like solute binding protein [Allosphingosinicella sp.]